MSLNLYDSTNKTLTPLAGNARNPVQGATASANGVAGLVPAPLIADREKFLRGDGTWAEGGSGNTNNYMGTKQDWDLLSTSEKDAYDTMDFTDEYDTVPVDDVPTASSNNLVKSGGVYSAIQTLSNQIQNNILYFTGVTCSVASNTTFATCSNASITADHVVAECIFANPSYITSDVTWTTADGSVTLSGTCSTATTVNLVLVKKGN